MFTMPGELREYSIKKPHFPGEETGSRRWKNLSKVQQLTREEPEQDPTSLPRHTPAFSPELQVVTFQPIFFSLS